MTHRHRRNIVSITGTTFGVSERFQFKLRLIFLKDHLENCLESLVERVVESIEDLWLILKLEVNLFELVFIKSELEKQRIFGLQVVDFLY